MTLALPTLRSTSIDSLLLAGEAMSADIRNAVTTGPTVDWPIDSAPTVAIKLHDPHGQVRKSALLKATTSLHIDDIPWRLAVVAKQGTEITLTFEHGVVAALRQHKDTYVQAPGAGSRIDFAKHLLLEEPWIKLVVPFAAADEAVSNTELRRGTTSGAATKAYDISSLPSDITGTDVANALNPPGNLGQFPKAQLSSTLPTSGPLSPSEAGEALILAGWPGSLLQTMIAIGKAESGLRVDIVSRPNSNGTVDRGWLQINSVHTQFDAAQLISDPVYNAQAAFSIYEGQGLEAWSTYNSGAYQAFMNDGAIGATAASAGEVQPSTGSATAGKPEDTWTCLVRIFEAVHWRVFVRGKDELWLTPDFALYQAGPNFTAVDTSVAQTATSGDASIGGAFSVGPFTEDSPGVDSIDFTWDSGQITASATLTGRAELWGLWVGQACALSDIGPASGTWIVSRIQRDVNVPTATIDFTMPRPALPEPNNQPTGPLDSAVDPISQSVLDAFAGAGDASRAASGAIGQADAATTMIQWAQAHIGVTRYVLGASGPNAYDCSSFVQAAAAAAGISLPRTSEAQYAVTGHVDVATAARTRGALLFRRAGTLGKGDSGHVAISLGNGSNIAALNPSAGVAQTQNGSQFNGGGIIGRPNPPVGVVHPS